MNLAEDRKDPQGACSVERGDDPDCEDTRRPSLMERLLRRKKRLHEQLDGCNAAIEALTEDPKLEDLYTGIRAADRY